MKGRHSRASLGPEWSFTPRKVRELDPAVRRQARTRRLRPPSPSSCITMCSADGGKTKSLPSQEAPQHGGACRDEDSNHTRGGVEVCVAYGMAAIAMMEATKCLALACIIGRTGINDIRYRKPKSGPRRVRTLFMKIREVLAWGPRRYTVATGFLLARRRRTSVTS